MQNKCLLCTIHSVRLSYSPLCLLSPSLPSSLLPFLFPTEIFKAVNGRIPGVMLLPKINLKNKRERLKAGKKKKKGVRNAFPFHLGFFYLANALTLLFLLPTRHGQLHSAFPFIFYKRRHKLCFCNCSLLITEEEKKPGVKSGSHTDPRLYFLFACCREIAVEKWGAELTFKKMLKKKKLGLFTEGMILSLWSGVYTFNRFYLCLFIQPCPHTC